MTTQSLRSNGFAGESRSRIPSSRADGCSVSGEVRRYRFSKELIHPEVEVVPSPEEGSTAEKDSSPPDPRRLADASVRTKGGEKEMLAREDLGRVVPVYSAPEGMNPRTLRSLIGQAVDAHSDLLEGHLPVRLVEERGLPSVASALKALHRPGAGCRRRAV